MESKFVLGLMILASCAVVEGLKCFQCTDISVSTDGSIPGLDQLPEDKACRDDDVKQMNSTDCNLLPGFQVKCVKTKGSVEMEKSGKTIKLSSTARGCAPSNEPVKCVSSSDRSLVQQIPFLKGYTVKSVEGTACICDGDNCNGQTTLVPAIMTSLVSVSLVLFVAQ